MTEKQPLSISSLTKFKRRDTQKTVSKDASKIDRSLSELWKNL